MYLGGWAQTLFAMAISECDEHFKDQIQIPKLLFSFKKSTNNKQGDYSGFKNI